jgi:hypothetical protein
MIPFQGEKTVFDVGQRLPFHKAVKFVTAVPHEKDVFVKQRRSRAVEWFTRWHIALAKAEFPKDKKRALAKAAAQIQLVKERGLDEMEMYCARAQYQKWKEQDKSQSAKCSRSKRGKKKDERRGARSDKVRKALLSTVKNVYGREGAIMFIKQSRNPHLRGATVPYARLRSPPAQR